MFATVLWNSMLCYAMQCNARHYYTLYYTDTIRYDTITVRYDTIHYGKTQGNIKRCIALRCTVMRYDAIRSDLAFWWDATSIEQTVLSRLCIKHVCAGGGRYNKMYSLTLIESSSLLPCNLFGSKRKGEWAYLLHVFVYVNNVFVGRVFAWYSMRVNASEKGGGGERTKMEKKDKILNETYLK